MVWDQADNGTSAEETVFHDLLRIRPLLSLSFPGTDVYSVEEVERNDQVYYLLTVTFLGLYGASSPLPTHYTEDLLDEASDDRTVSRDFLDILSSPFYRLFYQCWSKNRWFIKLADEEAADYLERLYSLMGPWYTRFPGPPGKTATAVEVYRTVQPVPSFGFGPEGSAVGCHGHLHS